MRRIALIVIIVFLTLAPLTRPAAAQETCIVLAQGSGWGPVSIFVPSWATRLRFDVVWSGLQLRVFLNGVVYATDMYGDGTTRTLYTPSSADGFGGTWTVEFGGIMLDSVGAWTVSACGSPPPTPTPVPTPTAVITTGPGCITRVGERPVWVGEGSGDTPSLTLYGPANGWWIVSVRQDQGGSGAQYVGWRVTTTTGIVLADRMVDGEFEVRAGMTVTITPYRTALTGPGLVGVWVTITADCTGLVPTPLTADWLTPGGDDIRPVEFGIEEASAPTCVLELPYVSVTFSPPLVDPFTLAFPGVRVCFLQKWLVLRWGDFNLIDWAIPLMTLGLVWSAWLSIRRG